VSALLALVASGDAEVAAGARIELRFVARRERVEMHDHSIATVLGIDGEELVIDTDVAKIQVYGAGISLVKELQDGVEVDVAYDAAIGVVSLVRCLRRFAVHAQVIRRAEPSLEQAVEIIESEWGSGTDFRFELALRSLEESFDESAGGRIAWRPVQQLDVQLGASQNESFGVVDFGVVHIKFAAGAVVPPGAEQRIDQDVQVLPDVVAGADDVAAVAIDPGREMGLDGPAVLDDRRTMLEISHPERVALLSGPSAADDFAGDSELASCGSLASQMAIERGARHLAAELAEQDAIDDLVAAVGLLLCEFDGAGE